MKRVSISISMFLLLFLSACTNREVVTETTDSGNIIDVRQDYYEIGNIRITPEQENTFSIVVGDKTFVGINKGYSSKDLPLSMLALRDIDIGYEMMYGAFKPRDRKKTDWIAPQRLEYRISNSDELTIDMYDSKGLIGSLIFKSEKSTIGEYLSITPIKRDRYNRFSLAFDCTKERHFIGFGAQSIDVDHFSNTLYGWVQEQGIGKVMHDNYDDLLWYVMGRKHSSQIPIPTVLSSRNYIVTLKDDIRPVMALCSEESRLLRFEVGIPSQIFIFTGSTPVDTLRLATYVTGMSRMPPDFAFFPWIDAIFGSENVRRVASKLRENQIPASTIWTEDYNGGSFKGDRYVLSERWNIDRTLYPDFERLASDLHKMGFKFLVYYNPFVYQDSDVFEELDSKGLLIKDSQKNTYLFDGVKGTKASLLDLMNDDTTNWVKAKMDATIKMGADGWMGDFAEWLPTDSLLYDSKSGEYISGLNVHNIYPVLWQKLQREIIDSQGDGKDRLFFARSGWFGTPQIADVIWAGDQRTSFDKDDGLPTILPIGIGLGICGISNYGHDIAGYQSITNPPSDKELFFRWTTIGAYSPIMRTHHGYMPKLNWSWEKDDQTIKFFKRYAQIHASLFPYLKTMSKKASTTGIPVMRPLALQFWEEDVWTIKDAYMLGDDILVSPVVQKDQTQKSVYLPEGRWAPIEQDGDYLLGKQSYLIDTPLDHIPVFAREGSIIPYLREDILTNVDIKNDFSVSEEKWRYRVIKLFFGRSNTFTEFNGTRYSFVMLSENTGDFSPEFSTGNRKIPPCISEEMSCFRKIGDHTYSIFLNSDSSLEISSGNIQIAHFKVESIEKFDMEIRLFY